MSAVPVRLGAPSFRQLTDPITSCRQRSEQTPSRPHRITPNSRQAREVLRLLAEEGIEGSGKEAEPRGDSD